MSVGHISENTNFLFIYRKIQIWIEKAASHAWSLKVHLKTHSGDYVGKLCEVVDVQMDVNVVAMLLPCCCHSVERFCTHILLYRKRNCRWANCAIVAMLLPCCCYAVTMLSLCFRPLKKRFGDDFLSHWKPSLSLGVVQMRKLI